MKTLLSRILTAFITLVLVMDSGYLFAERTTDLTHIEVRKNKYAKARQPELIIEERLKKAEKNGEFIDPVWKKRYFDRLQKDL